MAVQYAFHADAQGANLYNDAGLPASPSRTDDWPLEPPGLAEKDSGRVLINHRNRALPVVGSGALSARTYPPLLSVGVVVGGRLLVHAANKASRATAAKREIG